MRRFLALVFVIGLAIPAGISLEGCSRNPGAKYCNGLGYGLKLTDVASLTLQPVNAGISLAYGQTSQVQTPTAATCKGDTVDVSASTVTFGTSNNQLIDISPQGAICAGTWNRNTGGGIPDYTTCNSPSPLPASSGLPYAVAFITASSNSVTSNPVAVYVHAPISSISLVVPPNPLATVPATAQCYSQTQTAQLDAEACFYGTYNGVANQYELCAPASVVASGKYACPGGAPPNSTLKACTSTIGTMNFTLGTSSVASINATTNVITASQPGTTVVTASVAQSASSAGYFSTCPPASISVTLPNGSTTGTVTQGVPQNLATTVVDTNGKTITGVPLTYQSTNPIDITANTNGAIAASFPGVTTVTAVCQPSTCNPAPSNVVGVNGTGLPLSSNPVNITVPGTASDFVWFGAPGVSQYFAQIQLLTGTLSSTVRLPYVPNSMVMDQGGNEIYFGSVNGLMVVNTLNNGLGTQASNVPGVVLAVSPDNSKVLVNDQARHLFYLYGLSDSSIQTFPGMGNAAQWTPDSQTLYITDNAMLNTPASCPNITGHSDALYVYNKNSGWTTYPLQPSTLPPSQIPTCSAQANVWAPTQYQTPAIVVPGVGAYLRGDQTEAHTWCPSGTVGSQATIKYFPLGDSKSVRSDSLAATTDGHHVLGAQLNGGGTITLNDVAVTVPTSATINGIATPAACTVNVDTTTTPNVQTMVALPLTSTVTSPTTFAVNATSVNQVITGSTPTPPSGGVGSSLAFITYSGDATTTGAQLPYYMPLSSGAGVPGLISLTGASTITAPVAGAFSPDNTLFFVSTAGDNKIHYISIPNTISGSTQPTDTKQVSPNLPACSQSTDTGCAQNGSGTVPATVILVKPRATT